MEYVHVCYCICCAASNESNCSKLLFGFEEVEAEIEIVAEMTETVNVIAVVKKMIAEAIQCAMINRGTAVGPSLRSQKKIEDLADVQALQLHANGK